MASRAPAWRIAQPSLLLASMASPLRLILARLTARMIRRQNGDA